MLKHGILGLLNYADMTGYEIMTAFRDSLQFFWSANTSQIYRELQTLKKSGFVTDTHFEQQGRPDKNIFSITDSGREELKKWLQDEDYGKLNFGLLMKTFFAGELTPAENIQRFQHLIAGSEQFLTGMQQTESAAEQYASRLADQKNQNLYWKMTISFGKRYMQMMKEWSQECIRELEGMGE